nr:hypothetical protein CFP56_75918 [Quercus suber]
MQIVRCKDHYHTIRSTLMQWQDYKNSMPFSYHLVCLGLYFSLSIGYPPDPPFYKANFDRTLFRGFSSAGIGVVVRDFKGTVIRALSKWIGLPPSDVDVEALACKRDVSFAIEIGLQEAVSERDSEMIINSLNSDCSSLAHFGHPVEDCRVHVGNLRFFALTRA